MIWSNLGVSSGAAAPWRGNNDGTRGAKIIINAHDVVVRRRVFLTRATLNWHIAHI